MTERSDKFTIQTSRETFYSDFLTSFSKNPTTGFLARVVDDEAIKQSFYNLIFTKRTERFYQSSIGCKISALLFEPIDEITADQIKLQIRETIENNEPRVALRDIVVSPDELLNGYVVTIVFSILNKIDDIIETNLILKRVR